MHVGKDSRSSIVGQNVPRNGDIDGADREHLHTLSPELALDPGIWEVEERNGSSSNKTWHHAEFTTVMCISTYI